MAIIQSGVGTTLQTVDTTHLAGRFSGRPMELGASGGAYCLGLKSGIIAAGLGADSELYQMRWTSATKVCILRSVMISAAPGTTAFTAGPMEFYMSFARSWSADGTGGAAVVFSSGGGNKKRTDFPSSAFSDTGVRIATTTNLGTGTKTVDTNKMSTVASYVSSVATTADSGYFVAPGTYLWQRNTMDEYPILFGQNEGFVIRATVPATGTWQFNTTVEWAEIVPSEVTGW